MTFIEFTSKGCQRNSAKAQQKCVIVFSIANYLGTKN